MTSPAEAEPNPVRFVIGIDLGTTNSAVEYVDTAETPWRVRTLPIPQLVAPGQVESRDTLPSFHYQPAPGELPSGALRLPWSRSEPKFSVGFFARDHGTLVPGRMINSAKSWLCHAGVDRTAALLPWHGAEDVDRLSPVEVSARYLGHVRDAWNHRFSTEPIEKQDVVLTLPASFDEVARELTIAAAKQAGFPRVVLIEEPQAAFYAWIDHHKDDWEKRVSPGQKILVCDIGGGTTDFTLIRVRRAEGNSNDKVQFHRVAVGDHLILGGDNFDLALAHHVEKKLMGERKLEPRQWSVLVRTCRSAKESLLGTKPPERMTLTLPGSGSRLIGGSLQVEVTREEVQQVLLDGFLPRVPLDVRPEQRRSGFQEFGLPYAPDPAMTKYLAAFLTAHRHAGDELIGGLTAAGSGKSTSAIDPARPDIVLFNGGVFESHLVRERLIDALRDWFGQGGWEPQILRNDRLDLAVAHGAAYYGMVRRGEGVRIAAGLARTYYIGVDSDPPAAICLVPAGVEPGHDVDLTERTFDLLISEPVEFPLYVSSTRLTDRPGALVPIDREQMTALPPIRTVLKTGKKGDTGTISVNLHARLTEIGTLDLWCGEVGGKRTWRLQFDVRAATQTDAEGHEGAGERGGVFDESVWDSSRRHIEATFGPGGGGAEGDKPESLMRRLTEAIGSGRDEWPPTLLRRLWEALMANEAGRRRSPQHEARWLNLLGFSLRPGYGLAVDDWRVAEIWKALNGKLAHPAPQCRAEFWTLWRRIAGGLEAGHQNALATPHMAALRQMIKTMKGSKKASAVIGGAAGAHEMAEIWRMLGSFELLSNPLRSELGKMIVDVVEDPRIANVRPAMLWALGRVAARVPLYGPLNAVLPVDTVRSWLARIMPLDIADSTLTLAVMQAARKTGDRFRDLSESLRNEVAEWLVARNAPAHFATLVRDGGTLDEQEQGLIFGESLPRGLRLREGGE